MTIPTLPVGLGPGVRAWFTGRAAHDEFDSDQVGQPGNLSHRRPHVPGRLAADRRAAFARHGLEVGDVHLLRQVHGTRVVQVGDDVPRGTELPDADGAVTAAPRRGLAVLTADCVPVLVGGSEAVGVIHAGRRGLAAGIVEAGLEALQTAGQPLHRARAAIGPAIGGCCYEVPESLRADVADRYPVAFATTSWGTPSLDLPAAVADILRNAGLETVQVGACTHCDPGRRFFSHRADPQAGRQAGVIMLDPGASAA